MKSLCAFIFVLAVSGCATTTAPNIPLDQSKVKLLFEYPAGNYRVIGMRGFYIYKPGWAAPDLNDIWPSVVEGVSKERGNACILRSERIGQFDRSLSVTCEVLHLEYGGNKLPQAADGTTSSGSGENSVAGQKDVNTESGLVSPATITMDSETEDRRAPQELPEFSDNNEYDDGVSQMDGAFTLETKKYD